MQNMVYFRFPRGMPEEFKSCLKEAERLAREMYVPNPMLKDSDFCYDWLTTVWWARYNDEDPKVRLKALLSERRRQYLPVAWYDKKNEEENIDDTNE